MAATQDAKLAKLAHIRAHTQAHEVMLTQTVDLPKQIVCFVCRKATVDVRISSPEKSFYVCHEELLKLEHMSGFGQFRAMWEKLFPNVDQDEKPVVEEYSLEELLAQMTLSLEELQKEWTSYASKTCI